MVDFGNSAGQEGEDQTCVPAVAFVHTNETGGGLKLGAAILTERPRSDQEDKKTWSFEVIEFFDCEQFSNLEALLLRVGPKICFYSEFTSSAKAEKKRLENLLISLNVLGEPTNRSGFRTKDIQQDLINLCGDENLLCYKDELSLKLAMQALSCLVRKDVTGSLLSAGTCTLCVGKLENNVRLDVAAMEALNLFPGSDAKNKESSVFGVLDRCTTKGIGSRLLSRWIRQPLIDPSGIEERQSIVQSFVDDRSRLDSVRACLKRTPDLDSLVRKFEREKAGLEQMYILFLFVESLPELVNALQSPESGDEAPTAAMKEIAAQIQALLSPEKLGKYSDLVNSVLDFDFAPREFRVKTCHDESGKLSDLATRIDNVLEKVHDARESLMLNELSGMQAKFENDPKMLKIYGYHFRIHKRNDNALKRLKNKKYRYLNVVSSGIKWTTEELKELYSDYSILHADYSKAQAALVKDASEVARSFMPLFEVASGALARLDVLASFAFVASYAPNAYVRPVICNNESGYSVSGSRHPCLELQEDVDFIANDYELKNEVSFFQLITGPNMGGKSTYIRQLGIISIMAQIGSFVPCEEAKLPIVDAILARVGASDQQIRGVSTFMAEMIEASAILRTATKDSLVIIDELGRGTSTYDGFGLAWAISEYLAKEVQCYCLFATHFHELTSLELAVPGVVNRHVTALATEEAVTMLYAVNRGPCSKSFGINIAKLAGFPDDVIEVSITIFLD